MIAITLSTYPNWKILATSCCKKGQNSIIRTSLEDRNVFSVISIGKSWPKSGSTGPGGVFYHNVWFGTKSLMTGYPLSFLQEGIHSNKELAYLDIQKQGKWNKNFKGRLDNLPKVKIILPSWPYSVVPSCGDYMLLSISCAEHLGFFSTLTESKRRSR